MNLSGVDGAKGEEQQHPLGKFCSVFFLHNSTDSLALRKENCLYTSIAKQPAAQQMQQKTRKNVLDFYSYLI